MPNPLISKKFREFTGVACLAGWLTVTTFSQHPDRGFDKLRKLDPTGLFIPNWRFFAPEPAVDDTYLVYRLHNFETNDYTDWYSANQSQKRHLLQTFWFPGRREEKAVFDVTAGFLSNVNAGVSPSETRRLSAFKLLTNYVRREISQKSTSKIEGFSQFQWMIVRFSGYSEIEKVSYDYASPLLDINFDAEETTVQEV